MGKRLLPALGQEEGSQAETLWPSLGTTVVAGGGSEPSPFIPLLKLPRSHLPVRFNLPWRARSPSAAQDRNHSHGVEVRVPVEMDWSEANETPETWTGPRWTKLPIVERETGVAEISKRAWTLLAKR